MGLLLAAALAAHIQTGQDLLAVCKADQTACIDFIRSAATSKSDGACIDLRDMSQARREVIDFIATSPTLQAQRADRALYFIYQCGAAD